MGQRPARRAPPPNCPGTGGFNPPPRVPLAWGPAFSARVCVLCGAGAVGIDGTPVRTGQLAVLGPGDTVTVNGAVHQESRTPALDVVVLGAPPRRSPNAS